MTPLEKELRSALVMAADWIAQMQRQGCAAGPVAVPSTINDALQRASRVEAAEGCKITSDRNTVWINARGGWCIARFSLMGIDIHTEVIPGRFAQGCLYCRGGAMTREDWDVFVEQMQALYGVTVAHRHMPAYLKKGK